jgi:starch-binding outer membrane protein, SusD/RagB family
MDDLTTIRTNRVAVPDGHNLSEYYPVVPDASNILDIVLKERRVELAFEGHRLFDLLRNNKNMVRNYWGYHIYNYNGIPSSSEPGLSAEGVVTNAGDIQMIYPIPSGEISTNNLCVQNN